MIIFLFTLSIFCNAIMDNITFHNSYAKYGLWFSSDGWKCKYILAEWLNKYLPLWLSKFLAEDVLVVFTDLWHLSKMIMILSLCLSISFSFHGILLWFMWSIGFNIFFNLLR